MPRPENDEYLVKGYIVAFNAQHARISALQEWGWKRGKGFLGQDSFINLLGEEIRFIGALRGLSGAWAGVPNGTKIYLGYRWTEREDVNLLRDFLSSKYLVETSYNA